MTNRPTWCLHPECSPRRSTQNKACVGRLPQPEPHDGDHNTHRLCIEADGVFDLQINKSDAWWLRQLLAVVITAKE